MCIRDSAGTEEEQDFLGLPGLLDADQVKTLLRKRQSEQLDAREAEEKARRAEEAAKAKEPPPPTTTNAGAPSVRGADSGVASEDIPALRQELNARVAIMASRTGRPHGAIHTEVRKACGGPPTALCSAEQLRERIRYLTQW